MNNSYLLFRLVPTMKCNFKCNYCFLSTDEKAVSATMFDIHSVHEWVKAMKNFSQHQVEFYCWGGEPFILDETYELVKGWVEYAHVISGSRLDTNMTFAEKIAQRCPTDKIKLNCSWHTQYFPLDTIFNKVKLLNDIGMVGMVNFVASTFNLKKLENDYRLSVDDLIRKFEDIGVFVNIAADFSITSQKHSASYEEYKAFILKYTNPDDWKHLRHETGVSICTANKHFFTIQPNGDITPCLSNRVCGNFFDGTLNMPEVSVCHKECPSLVAYPFRTDNNFVFTQHLLEYVKRNKEYRASLSQIGKVFDICGSRLNSLNEMPAISETAPLVSIVLPTYNQVRYLPKAVESILNQTYQHFELIIVNDGSTDGTREYLDHLDDARILVIHQDNNRLPRALNEGFRHAKGSLLTWVSSDNYCSPAFLEAFIKTFSEHPDAGFAYAAFAWIDEEGRITGVQENQDMSWPNLIKCNPGIAAFMYRRECQDAVGFYDPGLEGAEDWDMWLRITEQFRHLYVPEILYYYRLHDDTMTRQMPQRIRVAARQTFVNAVKRQGTSLQIGRIYRGLGYNKDPELLTYAYLDLASHLLQSPYFDELHAQEVANALQAALRAQNVPLLANYLLILYLIKINAWDKALKAIFDLQRVGDERLLQFCLDMKGLCLARNSQNIDRLIIPNVSEQIRSSLHGSPRLRTIAS